MPFFLAVGTTAWESFWFLTFGVAAFYWTHWEEFHTDKLVMGVVANPTEVQCALMGVFIAGGIYGPHYFAQQMSAVLPGAVTQFITNNNLNYFGLLEMPLRVFMLVMVGLGVSGTCISLYGDGINQPFPTSLLIFVFLNFVGFQEAGLQPWRRNIPSRSHFFAWRLS